nr:MAG TPA: hypothetical protein [Caudoviricetes sp.]
MFYYISVKVKSGATQCYLGDNLSNYISNKKWQVLTQYIIKT